MPKPIFRLNIKSFTPQPKKSKIRVANKILICFYSRFYFNFFQIGPVQGHPSLSIACCLSTRAHSLVSASLRLSRMHPLVQQKIVSFFIFILCIISFYYFNFNSFIKAFSFVQNSFCKHKAVLANSR